MKVIIEIDSEYLNTITLQLLWWNLTLKPSHLSMQYPAITRFPFALWAGKEAPLSPWMLELETRTLQVNPPTVFRFTYRSKGAQAVYTIRLSKTLDFSLNRFWVLSRYSTSFFTYPLLHFFVSYSSYIQLWPLYSPAEPWTDLCIITAIAISPDYNGAKSNILKENKVTT